MPKRCLAISLYSLSKSSLFLAQAIYHLMGKDHVLSLSEVVILLGFDICPVLKISFIQLRRGGYLQITYLSHYTQTLKYFALAHGSFPLLAENRPAYWVHLVSMQTSGSACLGKAEVLAASTASVN